MKTWVQLFGIVHRSLNRLHRAVVSFDVDVVTEGLAVGGESVEDETAGLSEGKCVAFDGVGVVVPLEPELLLNLSKD